MGLEQAPDSQDEVESEDDECEIPDVSSPSASQQSENDDEADLDDEAARKCGNRDWPATCLSCRPLPRRRGLDCICMETSGCEATMNRFQANEAFDATLLNIILSSPSPDSQQDP